MNLDSILRSLKRSANRLHQFAWTQFQTRRGTTGAVNEKGKRRYGKEAERILRGGQADEEDTIIHGEPMDESEVAPKRTPKQRRDAWFEPETPKPRKPVAKKSPKTEAKQAERPAIDAGNLATGNETLSSSPVPQRVSDEELRSRLSQSEYAMLGNGEERPADTASYHAAKDAVWSNSPLDMMAAADNLGNLLGPQVSQLAGSLGIGEGGGKDGNKAIKIRMRSRALNELYRRSVPPNGAGDNWQPPMKEFDAAIKHLRKLPPEDIDRISEEFGIQGPHRKAVADKLKRIRAKLEATYKAWSANRV